MAIARKVTEGFEESRIGLKPYHPECSPFTTLGWKPENTGSGDALPASDSLTLV